MKLTSIIQEDISTIVQTNHAMSELQGHSFLISGATGFIGSYLIHSLLMNQGSSDSSTVIYAPVRSAAKARTMFGSYEEKGQIIFIEQDIREPIRLDVCVDYIIHCASNAAPKEYQDDPVGTMLTNFEGTSNLLEYAKEHLKKRFLYVSTIEVYGNVTGISAISESDYGKIDACNPRSCYPISKKACETMCISYFKQYQIPVSIGRLSYIYGPGMSPNDSKVAAAFPRAIAAGEDIVLKSSGSQRRSYCYVSDAISALFTILAYGNNGEAYNIASALSITTIRNMAERLAALFPESGSKVIFELPSDTEKQAFSLIEDSILNTDKLSGLGWQPLISLDSGLKRTVFDITDTLPK